MLAVAAALGLSTAELASGHSSFTLNNLIATLVATDILQLIGPRSFRTAGLLLVGLLLYDVFWVFGSPKVGVSCMHGHRWAGLSVRALRVGGQRPTTAA